jgi:hypothetical protein
MEKSRTEFDAAYEMGCRSRMGEARQMDASESGSAPYAVLGQEDRIVDLSYLLPAPLRTKAAVGFKSGINLQNGAVQLTYDESVEGKGKGQLTIPSEFVVGLAPFVHGAPYRVNARLRYRISDDKLTFAFALDRPHRVVESAFRLACVEIEEQLEGLSILWGTAKVGSAAS